MAKIVKIDGSFDRGFFTGTSCAFGVFDGVHIGHQFLFDCAKQTAQESGGTSIVLTFDIDPDELFRPDELRKLMSNEDRLDMLANCGVDAVVVLPFTREFANTSPERFLTETFDNTPPEYLHIGYDFRFGAHASGTVRNLAEWGTKSSTLVCAHPLKIEDEKPVTATRIRGLLSIGDIEEANKLLGRPYFMTGMVEPGRGEGADLGFATANLTVADQLRPIGNGVYAGWAEVDGKRYKAAINVGVAATFADRATATCEVHLLDFDADLYGKKIKVEFLHWLRPMRKFDDVDELVAVVKDNIRWVRENL